MSTTANAVPGALTAAATSFAAQLALTAAQCLVRCAAEAFVAHRLGTAVPARCNAEDSTC